MNLNIHYDRLLIEKIIPGKDKTEAKVVETTESGLILGVTSVDDFLTADAEKIKRDAQIQNEEITFDVSQHFYGKVIRCGEDCKYYKEGDIVVCHLRAGTEFNQNGKLYKLLTEKDIYGNIV